MSAFLLSVTAAEVFKYIGFVIVALIALMFMIVVHELGHYTAGKLLGFRIDEFGIGFGPPIFKKTNRKTGEVFTLRPFPIGGFCAFHGEDEDAKNDATAFNSQKAWKRLIVLFAGAFMNLVSAIFIITIFFTAYGQILPTVVDVHSVSSSGDTLLVGDAVLNVDGKQVNIMVQEDVDAVFANTGDTVKVKVLRGGKRIALTLNKGYYSPFTAGDYIESFNGSALDTALPYEEFFAGGFIGDDVDELTLSVIEKDAAGNITSRMTVNVARGANPEDADGWYSYGLGITRSFGQVKLPFFLALGRSFSFAFFIVFKILASIGALLTGQVGLESAGGTLTVIGTIAEVSSLGFGNFLYVVAVISANLAVMNLLPLPALDGSRMVFTLIEMIFRKPVPRKVEAVIHAVGLILLLLLAVFLDVFHLAHL